MVPDSYVANVSGSNLIVPNVTTQLPFANLIKNGINDSWVSGYLYVPTTPEDVLYYFDYTVMFTDTNNPFVYDSSITLFIEVQGGQEYDGRARWLPGTADAAMTNMSCVVKIPAPGDKAVYTKVRIEGITASKVVSVESNVICYRLP